ncbi:unnamed protein product [Arctia plantaginis]|uniref:Zinc finger DNA binding protein n=1 Tax=Arctia plantaginis TaxID=874455 RepID=A0A8S1ARE3_ARCPL|nr:unnamed protein product [Arctia plantaginis]
MSQKSIKHSGSTQDLSLETVSRRKRGHNDEFTEAFEQFKKQIMDTLLEFKSDISRETAEIKDSLKTINEVTQELKCEVNYIREEYSAMKKSFEILDTAQKKVQEEITTFKKSLQFHSDELKNKNKILNSNINESEQRDRLLNVEIVGVPEMPQENLLQFTENLANHAGVVIIRENIIHVNRVASKTKNQGRPKNIIIKLSTRQLRDNLISKARKCRLTTSDLQIHGKVTPIFVNEHLTIYNKNLLKKAKEISRSKEYQYTWSKNGRIYVRKAATAPAIPIADEEDLWKII